MLNVLLKCIVIRSGPSPLAIVRPVTKSKALDLLSNQPGPHRPSE